MATQRIRQYLLNHPGFQAKLDELIHDGILNEFPSIKPHAARIEIDWNYLLLAASAFARSDEGKHQSVALRIADTCLKSEEAGPSAKNAAAVILDTMANKRTQNLAVSRGHISGEWDRHLPLPLAADALRRALQDSIQTFDGERLSVNRFQKDFWEALNTATQISASAPTSAGKSFILREWVANKFRERPMARIAVIVPTRALIQEFADEFGADQLSGKLRAVTIHTIPLDDSINEEGGHLCVFTQERLHILLTRSAELSFDLIIVDEAQKIGDSYRGVLLEEVIGECSVRRSDVQIVYASPFVENPEYLLRTDSESRGAVVGREVTTVTQNLLFLNQKRGDSTTWNVSFENEGRSLDIGEIKLPFRPTPKSKRLTLVALAMGMGGSGNLVYANGAADAEKYAGQVYEGLVAMNEEEEPLHPKIKELIKLIRRTIHEKYLLATTLRRGVAFHYGNMPLLIRSEIESLFKQNVIKFLVCTGTLIEGVNLPCRAIFMRAPTKGKGQPMKASDFWNLAGRAGRWGQEFQGSIICVDTEKPAVWNEKPPKFRTKSQIKSSIDTSLRSPDLLLDYIRNGYPAESQNSYPEFDYVISFLFHILVREGDLEEFLPEHGGEDHRKIAAILAAELAEFPMENHLMFKHPGILPSAMKSLLEKFESMSVEELVNVSPVQPEEDDADKRYESIFAFINVELRSGWAHDRERQWRLKQLAKLSVGWMRGMPLAYLIKRQLKLEEWKKSQGYSSKNTAATIISVMKDVEEFARFKIPKYLRAFLDVLYFHAEHRGITDKLIKLPDLELWLELGVSTRTQMAFMELGLSRTSAIELMEAVIDTELGKEDALGWLRTSDYMALDLPGPVQTEIERTLARFNRQPG